MVRLWIAILSSVSVSCSSNVSNFLAFNNTGLVAPSTTFSVSSAIAVGQPGTDSNDNLQKGLNRPQGMHAHSGENGLMLFVADRGNHRVTVYESDSETGDFLDYMKPTRFVGQPTSEQVDINDLIEASDDRLVRPNDVFYYEDDQNSLLLIADEAEEGRILVYRGIPTQFTKADLVLKGVAASNQAVLGTPSSLCVGGVEKTLLVVDKTHDRLVGWKISDLVQALDQSDGAPDGAVVFDGSGLAPGSIGFSEPEAIACENLGPGIAVADFGNKRVLLWDVAPTTPNTAFDHSFRSWGSECPGECLSSPSDLVFSSDDLQLIVSDELQHRVLLFVRTPDGPLPLEFGLILGQREIGNRLPNVGGRLPNQGGFDLPSSLASYGKNLFIADKMNNRVMRFSTKIIGGTLPLADTLIGRPNFESTGISSDNLPGHPAQVSVSKERDIMVASDTGNHRVLIWKNLPTDHHAVADVVLGQRDFVTAEENTGAPNQMTSATALRNPTGVWTNGTELYVVDTGNHRVLYYPNIPNVNQAEASGVIGQFTFSGSSPNRGSLFLIDGRSLNSPTAIHRANDHLYIADSGNHRVLIWKDLSSNPLFSEADISARDADIVLGQFDIGIGGESSPDFLGGMNAPSGLITIGSRLFISDQGNNRVLYWDFSENPLTDGQIPDGVIGATTLSPSSSEGNCDAPTTGLTLCRPGQLHAEGNRLIVTDRGNHRILGWSLAQSIQPGVQPHPDIEIGHNGNYLSGHANGGVHQISKDGLRDPRGVWIVGGKIHVADSGNDRILIFPKL